MSEIRVSDGGVTVAIGGELADIVAALIKRTETAAVREIRAAAAEVVASSRADWYGPNGVTRRTGLSGDIQAIESIDLARGEVRISVGSVDKRPAGKSGKVVPLYVHRPRRTSLVEVPVSRDRWVGTTKSLRAPLLLDADGATMYRIKIHNRKSSDGKFLVPTLLRAPVLAKIKEIAARIATGASDGK